MRYTCGNCEYLKEDTVGNLRLYSCGKTGFCVPQSTDENKAIFHRIPKECPLSDDIVKKSENPVAKKHWIVIEDKKHVIR